MHPVRAGLARAVVRVRGTRRFLSERYSAGLRGGDRPHARVSPDHAPRARLSGGGRGRRMIRGAVNRYDAIVVGGGHHGPVRACYLARAGLKVLVLERNPYIGGAAVSRRLYDGFTYSNCSYVCSLLRTQIIRALELPSYGLQIIPYEGGCTLMRDGGHLAVYDNHDAMRREIARHSPHDAEAYDRYVRDMLRHCRFIKPLLLRTPPDPTSLP